MFRFLAVAALVAAASAFAPPLSVRPTSAVRSSSIVMEEKAAKAKKEKPPPKPKVPGEGDPFGAVAQAYSEANKDGLSAYQPRGISDATVIDMYQNAIETDDEPWHSTCRTPNVLGISSLECVRSPLCSLALLPSLSPPSSLTDGPSARLTRVLTGLRSRRR